jgi:type I restriction enzyme S subunit
MIDWPNFKLPKEWALTRLDDLAFKLKAGGTPSRRDKGNFGGDIPFVLIEDMTSSGVYLRSTKETITRKGLESSSAWIVPENTVLLSMYATIGATVITTFPVATNQAILAIVPREDCDREYLSFCLRAHKRHLARLNVESTQKNINKGIVSSFPIPLPPLPEQKKIAHILSTVQRAIEAQERVIQTTTELKKALMQKLFTEGLRHEPQKQTEIGPVPQSWEVMKLGSLAKVGNGSTPKRANEAYWEGGTIPWLNSTKIHDRFITEADQFVTPQAVKECHLPKVAPNSLLIAITGQGKTLGNSAITRIETCINQHLAYAQFHASNIVPDFVLWFMQTRYDYLRSIAHGGGSTKGALTCGFLKTLPVPVAPRTEQEGIAHAFQTLEDKQHRAARKQAALQDLFSTLLHELMTAKTRVHEMALSA